MSTKTTALPERLLTIDEVVARLGCKKSWLYDTRYVGRAPGSLAVRIAGRLVWDPTVLGAWFAAGAKPDWKPEA